MKSISSDPLWSGLLDEEDETYVHLKRDNSTSSYETSLDEWGDLSDSSAPLRGLFGFELPGLGRGYEKCGWKMKVGVRSDGRGVRYASKFCGRFDCPNCWDRWRRYSAFDMVVEIEVLAYLRGERPFAFVTSIDTGDCVGMSWDDVNMRVFRRGRRRAQAHGVEGAVEIFHPARVKECAVRRMFESGLIEVDKYGELSEDSSRVWYNVRNNSLEGEVLSDGSEVVGWRDYCEVGYHVHNVGFGEDLKKHVADDFFLRFAMEKGVKRGDVFNQDKVKRLDRGELVGNVMYILTHCGKWRGGKSQARRTSGVCRNVDYAGVPVDVLREIRVDVASRLGMVWDEERGEAVFVGDREESDDWVDVASWFSVIRSWRVPEERFYYRDFVIGDTEEVSGECVMRFWEEQYRVYMGEGSDKNISEIAFGDIKYPVWMDVFLDGEVVSGNGTEEGVPAGAGRAALLEIKENDGYNEELKRDLERVRDIVKRSVV